MKTLLVILVIAISMIYLCSCNKNSNPILDSEIKTQVKDNNGTPHIFKLTFTSNMNTILCDSIYYDDTTNVMNFWQEGCGESIPNFSHYILTNSFTIK